MTLETMRPNPTWDAKAHERELEPFERHADDLVVRVWGGDWCGDCRAVLPDLGAALDAAGVPDDRIHEYPVEKLDDGSKKGPKVEEYGIEYIPTVIVERSSTGSQNSESSGEIVERDGEEVARFVESEPIPAFAHLAEQLREIEASA
ncbi:thioredoxin family protein [Halalkalicoccus tibetensis]|uniref:Thioredoxin family protein n=1 Tax=Halalkalicoccus tibetensis TaxID=175632 RepID=A0ABD5UZZ6_9EURY